MTARAWSEAAGQASIDSSVDQFHMRHLIAVRTKTGFDSGDHQATRPDRRGRKESKKSAVSFARRKSPMLLSVIIECCIGSTDAYANSTLSSGNISSPCATCMPWASALSRKADDVRVLMTIGHYAASRRNVGSSGQPQRSHQNDPSSGVGNVSSSVHECLKACDDADLADLHRSAACYRGHDRHCLVSPPSSRGSVFRNERACRPARRQCTRVRFSLWRTFSNSSIPERSRARLSKVNSTSGKLPKSACKPRPSSDPSVPLSFPSELGHPSEAPQFGVATPYHGGFDPVRDLPNPYLPLLNSDTIPISVISSMRKVPEVPLQLLPSLDGQLLTLLVLIAQPLDEALPLFEQCLDIQIHGNLRRLRIRTSFSASFAVRVISA